MIIKKIFRNLKKPKKIPKKIIDRINYFINFKKYNQNEFEDKQNNIFNSLYLDRKQGKKKLDLILNDLEINQTNKRSMSSEHEIFFSSLSMNKDHQIDNILEIGTHDGFNSFLLSKLFPKSKIDTIDLPENEQDFIDFYNRKETIHKFIKKRNDILSKNENINFFPLNSLKLINHRKKYDLIWIDGAHGYPVVCIDIVNSLNLINLNGIIVCDDIFTKLKDYESDKMYDSIASYETLEYLKKQNLIKYELIYKRLSAKDNCLENSRKFIAIVKKIEKI